MSADVPPPIKVAAPHTPEALPPRHDTAEMPVTKGEMRRSFRLNEAYTLLVAVLAACGALLGAYRFYVSEARAAGVEAADGVAKRVTELAASQREVREDVRALYFAVMTRRPQERLERPTEPPPLADGGR